MRTLTLVRHAKSSWDDAAMTDFERPLNPRGRRDAPVMAARLHKALAAPEQIVSSPALRAITTAHVFADAFGIAHAAIRIEGPIYEADVGTLLGVVRSIDAGAQRAMMFGHNPGFTQLAQLLADCPFAELPTCAAVTIELPVRQWSAVAPGVGKVVRYDFPKDGS